MGLGTDRELDIVNIAVSLIAIIWGVIGGYWVSKHRRKAAIGLAGSTILLGLILLGITYSIISGITVWISTATVLIVFGFFFYVAARRTPSR